MTSAGQKCGSVGLLGLPNAGKSTLVNALVGQKVAIVSSKVQTTRARMRGIALHEDSQIILIDTPGVFKPKKNLDHAMVGAALSVIEETDVLLHIIDASTKNVLDANKLILDKIDGRKNCALVINKVDKIAKPDLLALAQAMNDAFPYTQTFMVSALKDNGLEALQSYLSGAMPQSEWIFPEDQVSDLPMRMLAAEITREKLFESLHQEVPYAVLVETEAWEDFDNGDVKISQIIYVQRDTQKAIVLGKGGQQIKKIGQRSREELEEIMERKVHVKLFVKVKENWQDLPEFFQLMGLTQPS